VLLTNHSRFALAAVVAMSANVVVASPAAAGGSAGLRPSPSFNGTVYAVAYRGSTVYVGGSFTSASSFGRTVSRQRLAAFNAVTGRLLSWAPPVNGTVKALAASGNAIYLAGDFASVDGRRRDGLARVDARSGAVGSFDHVVSGEAAALSAGGGRVYVGGRFGRVDGVPRANLAAFSTASGALDRRWQPTSDSRVQALRAAGGRVYVGGDFHRLNGVRGNLRLAALTAASGSLVSGFRPNAPAIVYAVAVDSRGVYAATGGAGGRAIAYTSSGAVRWTHLFNGDAQAITTAGGVTYVGGHFDTACRRPSTIRQLGCLGGKVSRVKLAAIDARGGLSSWNPHANGVVGVRALDSNGRQVAAGGEFTKVGGTQRANYATFG
jgi:hypothetical protein